jgi:hypothetical protein
MSELRVVITDYTFPKLAAHYQNEPPRKNRNEETNKNE